MGETIAVYSKSDNREVPEREPYNKTNKVKANTAEESNKNSDKELSGFEKIELKIENLFMSLVPKSAKHMIIHERFQMIVNQRDLFAHIIFTTL